MSATVTSVSTLFRRELLLVAGWTSSPLPVEPIGLHYSALQEAAGYGWTALPARGARPTSPCALSTVSWPKSKDVFVFSPSLCQSSFGGLRLSEA